ncbi:argininosuccinate synthase [Candidatus Sordicultor fermentans]|jgi:argininosuccinate synthase|uniref:argininosuccinate synthase n=1 Tax=Candidatus Sordicultor fermentans TaxID=1953203 RepID=UPI00169A57C7|nr:argininosuccinate synthase [Atribacterota bacterium]NLY04825.1 argininosuccinate synthase [Candidatus Atribacteria bacterium]HOA99495.1 argininosuccinate synthase [Candidatus Atribacteria bacterium]HOQ50193.1 argininosuccinate synthase [Candidatus Atribacteria bacterium]HPZ39460.1 argininosuccinate synthase [Candidatus Atribacteria bacterium]
MGRQKVVLAYSGGLDTSVAIRWLEEQFNAEVYALTIDVGQGKDVEEVRKKALSIGAKEALVFDAREEFLNEYVLPALWAQAIYEDRYPLATALSRPLIAKYLVKVAEEKGATMIAHGCTGKGNDQVRIEVSVMALNPDLQVVAPARQWGWSREEEIEYAHANGIPVPTTLEQPYSIDQNIWGRSIECGVLEDPLVEPPAEVFEWTRDPKDAPSEPAYLEIGFEEGVPRLLGGEYYSLLSLVEELNKIGGENGFGRVDHVENRLVGIKSREIYECPAALILLEAYRDLQNLVLPREVIHFKPHLEEKYAQLVYDGLWYSPLREALDAFMKSFLPRMTGIVRVKLYKGSMQVVGRKSEYSLYDWGLATYDRGDLFDHQASEGFIKIWGLPARVQATLERRKKS